ncbi:hypothetical protein PgNI_10368 [Pyricularia grisea]|uniref:Uncharacterized protein n=1 Tax=Pyricularia grisea TaxID=148305 RepID=A0A6P8AY41_PYRGI|nr:hypothetical protein PgNI_10368 [Pyricularia grisea]TLD07252.1 hypothetical protein PgNI_10368 [Pyricularia grisea]
MYFLKAFLLLSVFGLAQLAAANPVSYVGLEARDQKPICQVGTNGDGTNPADTCTDFFES